MSCIKEVLLPVDADDAWEAVTEPEALEEWLADTVELDLREGGSATFVLPGGEERRAVVEEVAPGERWSFWWWTGDAPGSRVTVELAPAIGGTTIRVTEAPVGPWASAAPPLAQPGPHRSAAAPLAQPGPHRAAAPPLAQPGPHRAAAVPLAVA